MTTDMTFDNTVKMLGIRGVISNGMCSWILKTVMVRSGLAVRLPKAGDIRITTKGLEKFNELFPKEVVTIAISDLVTHKVADKRNLGIQYKVVGWVYGRDKEYYCSITPYIDGKTPDAKVSYPTKISDLRHLTYEELATNEIGKLPV